MQVNPQGSKLWRLKYRINGVERKLALGSYPEISLAEAREARDAARKQVAHSIDPNFAKREARIEAGVRARNSFAHVADDLIQKKTREGLAAPTLKKMHWFVKLLGPEFGRRPIADITPHEILHGRAEELKGPSREMVDYFVADYKPVASFILGMLVVAELRLARIGFDEETAVREMFRSLIAGSGENGLAEEGMKRLNAYANGGYEFLAENYDPRPQSAEESSEHTLR